MGIVYLAQDVKHHRQVAIKVLKPDVAAVLGPERFLREIEMAGGLSHPHILALHDSGEADGFLYYVMPYVAGESLRERLSREKQLPLEDAVRITGEIASALDHAHRRNVLHRDVKPENILLQEGHAVVADFGIARAIIAAGGDTLTATGLTVGTPAYMSPEQAAGERELDGRSDLYSLGCVLYEMLAGQPPFTGPTVESVLHQHLTADPAPVTQLRRTVPESVVQVLGRALSKAPADRYATAAQFGAALDAALRVPLRVAPRRSPRRLVAGIVGALVLATVLGLVVRTMGRGGHSPALNSVAVLYFDNLSGDTADAYLADGLTDEIIARLGQIERLKVKSRTAVQHYRGAGTEVAALSRALSVAYLVNGTVRRGAGRLRVTVELLRTPSGDRLWGQQYDRAQTDLLAIQEDIAVAVTATIAGRLLPAERSTLAARPTRNPEAYDRFVKGNYYIAQRTARAVKRAIAEYRAAVLLDPSFARALARIAYAYALFLDWGWDYPGLLPESLLAQGFAAADSALRQDSSASDAWMARAYLLALRDTRTPAGATEAFERAISLDPRNGEAYHQYAYVLMGLGQDSAAAESFRRALDLDPERSITLYSLGLVRINQRRYDEGLRWLDSAVSVDPGFAYAYADRAWCRLWIGQARKARTDAELAVRLGAGSQGEAALASVDAQEGDTLSGRRRIDHLMRGMADSLRPGLGEALFTGAALVALNERERAIDLLERVRPRGWSLWFRLRYPPFDPLRSDRRFQRLVVASRPPGAPEVR
jgi:serine/threonine-protein kinase